MSQRSLYYISRYGCAFVSIALAIAVRLLLDPVLGDQLPFPTVWFAVLVTAWYGGFRPAFAAVVLGAFASDYFLLPPRGSIKLIGSAMQVGMALYIVVGIGIALLGGSMHGARDALKEANDLLEKRVRERTAELARTTDELRASEEHFRVIVEGVSSHAIYMLDPAGNIACWNHGSERIKGYKADEIVGRHFSQFYTPEDVASGKPERSLQTAVADGFFEEEGVRVRKDGSRFWAIINITPLYDHASQHIGFLKVTRDMTKRKELADALAEAARFNRATLDGLSAHIAILGEDGTIEAVNKPWDEFAAANNLVAGTASMGTNYLTVCDGSAGHYAKEGPAVAAGIRAVLAGSVPQFVAEYPCDSPDERRWFVVRVTSFPGEGRRRVIVAHENITERKLAENSLRAERDRFEKIVSAVPVVICSYLLRSDGTSCFPFANPAIEEIYGFRLEELALDAAPIFTRMHPHDVDCVRVTLDECGRTMTPWRGEFRVRNPTRGEIWVEGHVIPSAEPNGAILWQGYIADITERKRAEEALHKSEALYRTLFNYAPDGIVIADPESTYIDGNTSICQMLGYSRDELIGMHASAIVVQAEIPHIGAALSMLNDKAPYHREWQFRRKDGSVFVADVIATKMPDGNLLGMIRDVTERKQIEESRNLFRVLLDRSNDAIEVIDLDTGRFIDANETAYKSLGYTREEFLALSVPDTNPSIAERGWGPVSKKLQRSGFVLIETQHRRKDGSTFPVEVNAKLIRLDREYSVAVVRDISERKRADKALRESDSRFRQIAENIREVFWLTDPVNDKILYVSPAYETVWGRESQALYQSPGDWLDAIHTDDRAGVHQAYASLLSAGNFDVEYRIIRPDGTIRWIHDRGFPILDAASNVYRIAGVAEDISQRKRVAQSLRDSEERTRLLLDSAVQPIYGIDMNGNCTFSNAACARMLGYEEPARLMDQNMHALIHHTRPDGTRYPVEECLIYLAFIQGLGTHVDDEVLWRADGTSFPTEYWSNPIRRAGQIVGAVVSFLDITERKTLEAQLQQSQKMEAFGQLAGGVAHDFNNLLTVISGYSDLLLMTLPPDDENRDLISEIRNAGERAASLTRQLLAFSRQQVLEPRVLDLNAVVTDTEKMLRRLIGEDVRFTTVLRSTISAVKVDPGQIEQVIMNLAVNARDAMPQGGQLTIETSEVELDESYAKTHAEVRPGRFVMLAISDTGGGMTPAVKARVFEPFFTTKGVGKGTGLGLAVVHGIVKQSGGSIELYSEMGAGTTFKIYLPAVRERPAGLSNPGLAHSPRGHETILLVEDEDAVREFTARTLQGFGYTVLKASGGQAAHQLIASHQEKIDLLVTDVVMAELSGRQLAETLLADHPGLKVLFLSGYTDDAVVRHGVLQADVAFLQKPFTPNSLAKKVREVLDQQ